MATPCPNLVVPNDATINPPLRAQLDWYLDLIGSDRDINEAELAEHLAPAFLQQVPAEQILATLPQVRALGPFSPRYYEGPPTDTELNLRLGVNSGEEARLHMLVEPRPPYRLVALSVLTQQPCALGR